MDEWSAPAMRWRWGMRLRIDDQILCDLHQLVDGDMLHVLNGVPKRIPGSWRWWSVWRMLTH